MPSPHKSRTICTKTVQLSSNDSLYVIETIGGPTRIRTWDQRIMSPLL